MKEWWSGLSGREQRLMMIGGIALLIAILYWGLWQPLADRSDRAQNRISSERQLLSWVSEKADEIVRLRGNGGGSNGGSDLGLNQVVNETTAQFRIELIRMQPRQEALQVWVKPVPFNTLMNWLTFLRQEHGIQAQFLDVSRGEASGLVEVNRLQLGRG